MEQEKQQACRRWAGHGQINTVLGGARNYWHLSGYRCDVRHEGVTEDILGGRK